jgi:hypothetical protein
MSYAMIVYLFVVIALFIAESTGNRRHLRGESVIRPTKQKKITSLRARLFTLNNREYISCSLPVSVPRQVFNASDSRYFSNDSSKIETFTTNTTKLTDFVSNRTMYAKIIV